MTASKKARILGLALLTLLMCAGMYLRYTPVFEDPNTGIGESPDGFKNYATVIYHVKWDSTYMHYDGMNYPYGDHLLFADAQPVYANVLRFIHLHIAPIADNVVGWMNFALLLGLLVCAGLLYGVFLRLGLPVWYAVPVAMGIAFLSPQCLRMEGHYGLAHTWVVPLMLWLLYGFEERPGWWSSLPIAVMVLLVPQLHFYFFGITGFFLTLFVAIKIIRERFRRDTLFFYLKHWVVWVIVPFVLLHFWTQIGNPVTDRPGSPWGFLLYVAIWESVFLPPDWFPLHQWINGAIMKIQSAQGEGIGYVGLTAFFYTLFSMFRGVKLFTPFIQKVEGQAFNRHFLRDITWPAVLLLMFSFGLPFNFPGLSLEWMLDYLGPLRQFRSIGRFTWIFFYVVNILAFYFVFWQSRKIRVPAWRTAAMLLPLALLGYEAEQFHQKHIGYLKFDEIRADYAAPAGHWSQAVDFSKYQAILPLPYYHAGSECYAFGFEGAWLARTNAPSLRTGIPNIGNFLSRTSIQQTMKELELVLAPSADPMIFGDLKSHKPLLLAVQKGIDEGRLRSLEFLTKKSVTIYEDEHLSFRALPLDSLRAAYREMVTKLDRDIQAVKLYPVEGFLSTDSTANFLHKNFDDSSSATHFRGEGAYIGKMAGPNILFDGKMPLHQKGTTYVLSFWSYIRGDQYGAIESKVREYIPLENREVHLTHDGLRFHLKAIEGDWGLFEVNFEIRENNSQISIEVGRKELKDQPLFIDELLVKPVGITLYQRDSLVVRLNNQVFRK